MNRHTLWLIVSLVLAALLLLLLFTGLRGTGKAVEGASPAEGAVAAYLFNDCASIGKDSAGGKAATCPITFRECPRCENGKARFEGRQGLLTYAPEFLGDFSIVFTAESLAGEAPPEGTVFNFMYGSSFTNLAFAPDSLQLRTKDGTLLQTGSFASLGISAVGRHSYALIRTRGELALYMDGTLLAHRELPDRIRLLMMGNSLTAPGGRFLLDEVLLYNSALDAGELFGGLTGLHEGPDADGDGIPDQFDPCPANIENDGDADGLCEANDPCPLDRENDADDDGVCAPDDICPHDPLNDADNDGVCGDIDRCEGFDDTADADNDGVPDGCDRAEEVSGCTDSEATNSNLYATVDDGSCEYAPVITLFVIPATLSVGEEGAFSVDATDADGDALTFTWEFGDGASSAEEDTTHSYAASDTYDVTVTVSDPQGNEVSRGGSVAVEEEVIVISGCTDPDALNPTAGATVDDGSCTYPPDEDISQDSDGDGIPDGEDNCPNTPAGKSIYRTGSTKGCMIGDATGGGCVNIIDVGVLNSRVKRNFSPRCPTRAPADLELTPQDGDMNGDGCVNIIDVGMLNHHLKRNFNPRCIES